MELVKSNGLLILSLPITSNPVSPIISEGCSNLGLWRIVSPLAKPLETSYLMSGSLSLGSSINCQPAKDSINDSLPNPMTNIFP